MSQNVIQNWQWRFYLLAGWKQDPIKKTWSILILWRQLMVVWPVWWRTTETTPRGSSASPSPGGSDFNIVSQLQSLWQESLSVLSLCFLLIFCPSYYVSIFDFRFHQPPSCCGQHHRQLAQSWHRGSWDSGWKSLKQELYFVELMTVAESSISI